MSVSKVLLIAGGLVVGLSTYADAATRAQTWNGDGYGVTYRGENIPGKSHQDQFKQTY
ncbi:MAG TPA: hypothetical protein VIH40_03430 [Xanthobacteraceae bacterium]